jgi:hypothetical protein
MITYNKKTIVKHLTNNGLMRPEPRNVCFARSTG